MGIVPVPIEPKKKIKKKAKPLKKKPVTPKVKKGVYRGKPIGRKPKKLYT